MYTKIKPSFIRQILRTSRSCQQNPRNYLSSRSSAPVLSILQFTEKRDNQQQGLLIQSAERHLSLSGARFIEGTTSEFREAVSNSSHIKEADNHTKLRLYALFKQSSVGKNNTKKPGMLDLIGKAKWDAWNTLGDMSKSDAEKEYISLVNGLLEKGSKKAETTSQEEEGLTIHTENRIRTIKLNRPTKKNALTLEMYLTITKTLKEANDDDSVNILVLTGAGDFFCSGNDLGNFMTATDPMEMSRKGKIILQNYIDGYIYLKKPLVAIINGPAVGIAVTVLGLCDAVFATDRATFTSPFSALGQSPEGCSSYTFPRIMGYAKASELLYFNQKFTARQAEQCGLITQVFPDDRLQVEAWKRINDMAELPIKSLVYSKELVRGRERELLHQVNVAECERLEERWPSDDCINAVMKFFQQRSKM